jgi:uncharacterized protein (TIGR03067 family)
MSARILHGCQHRMRCKIVLAGVADPAWSTLSRDSCLDLNRKSNYKVGISMRFRSLVVGVFVIGSLFAANAQRADGSRDLQALQGPWRLIAGEIGSRKMPPEELKNAKLVFKGDHYRVRRGSGPAVTGIVKLNPANNARSIDITDANGPYKGKTLLGIYALKATN